MIVKFGVCSCGVVAILPSACADRLPILWPWGVRLGWFGESKKLMGLVILFLIECTSVLGKKLVEVVGPIMLNGYSDVFLVWSCPVVMPNFALLSLS